MVKINNFWNSSGLENNFIEVQCSLGIKAKEIIKPNFQIILSINEDPKKMKPKTSNQINYNSGLFLQLITSFIYHFRTHMIFHDDFQHWHTINIVLC